MKIKVIAAHLTFMLFFLISLPALAREEAKFSVKISAEMELLAGVLTQTTWIEQRGPEGEGNEYYRALRDFFAPYKTHDAVKVAQELTDLGYTYDAPVAFICHLGPLPELELKYEYSPYIIGRARDRDRLERFRLALKDLARESNFLEFYGSWQPRFNEWLAAADLDGDLVVSWLEGFFGKEASEFYLFLAPAMFPAGGYGANITTSAGEMISFQIIRESGRSTDSPEFPSGRSLEHLSLHEWGHSFVNPALEAHPSVVAGLNPLFKPVAKAMRAQAYGNVHTFMNEQVLRAVTTIAAEELHGREAYESYLAYEKERSFYLTEDVIDILRDYQNNRDVYPTFDDFVPVLLTRMETLKPPLFHITGMLISLLILLPNLIFFMTKPENMPGKGIGRIGVFILPVFSAIHLEKTADFIALTGMVIALLFYYAGWMRYYKSKREYRLLFSPLMGMPVPMAVSPVVYFIFAATVLRSPYLFIAAAILAVGHIPGSLRQYSNAEQAKKTFLNC